MNIPKFMQEVSLIIDEPIPQHNEKKRRKSNFISYNRHS